MSSFRPEIKKSLHLIIIQCCKYININITSLNRSITYKVIINENKYKCDRPNYKICSFKFFVGWEHGNDALITTVCRRGQKTSLGVMTLPKLENRGRPRDSANNASPRAQSSNVHGPSVVVEEGMELDGCEKTYFRTHSQSSLSMNKTGW